MRCSNRAEHLTSTLLQRGRMVAGFDVVNSGLVVAATATVLISIAAWLLSSWSPVKSFLILNKIPSPKGTFFLGNIEMDTPHQHRLLLKYARMLGGVYRLRILWQQASLMPAAKTI